MRDAGTAVLLVEQNARRALETADIGCVLDLGRVHISGPARRAARRPPARRALPRRPTRSPSTDRRRGQSDEDRHADTHLPHHHERRHRPDGLPPAPGAVDPRDPRRGRHRAAPTAPGSRSSRCWSAATATSWPSSPTATASPSSPPTSTRRSPTTPRDVYFDAQVTSERKKAILKALAAGKHVYTEKPIAESVEEGLELAEAAAAAGIINGVVHDKLYLPGLIKLKRLIDAGFFGRILSVRGEFGYWVFEGDWIPVAAAQLELPRRGRRRDGPRHVLPLELRAREPLRPGRGGDREGGHPHPRALGRAGQAVRRHGRRRGVRDLRARGRRHRADQLLVGGAGRPRGAGRVPGRRHPRLGGRRAVRLPGPAAGAHAQAGVEPRPADRPRTSARQWDEVPDNQEFGNGFRAQWEQFLLDVDAGRPHPYDFMAGVRGLRAGRGRAAVLGRGPAGAAGDPQRGRALGPVDPGRRTAAGARSSCASRGRVGRPPAAASRSRVAFAAAHVVADPLRRQRPRARPPRSTGTPRWRSAAHLFRYGFGVAEAMDTAQRNMGLDWPAVQELVRRSAAQAAGATAPGSPPAPAPTTVGRRHDRRRGRRRLRRAGRVRRGHRLAGDPDGLARSSPRVAQHPDDYLRVYGRILGQVREPVILHWLGEVFDPQLRGYWGSADVDAATATFLELVRAHADEGRRRQGVAALGRARDRAAGRAAGRASGSTPATTSTTPS